MGGAGGKIKAEGKPPGVGLNVRDLTSNVNELDYAGRAELIRNRLQKGDKISISHNSAEAPQARLNFVRSGPWPAGCFLAFASLLARIQMEAWKVASAMPLQCSAAHGSYLHCCAANSIGRLSSQNRHIISAGVIGVQCK